MNNLVDGKGISNKRWIRALIAFLLALPSYAFLLLIRNRSFQEVYFYAYAQYVMAVFIGLFLLFEVHHIKSTRLERKISWKNKFSKRLWLEFLLALVMAPPFVTGAYAGLYLLIWKMPLYTPSIILYNALGFFISLLFMGFVNAGYILNNWKSSALKAERLEKEQVKATLRELQNQLSPHFLFNHFNILYSLIDENPEKAKEFLHRLSEIYRYVLGHKEAELVGLEKEIEFLNHYIFLMKTRFDDKIRIQLHLEEPIKAYKIPPLSLQILIENAIKHNEASAKTPLDILIRQQNAYLIVTNSYQPKSSIPNSTQTGLSNIRKRMAFLTDRPVVVSKKKRYFEVQLPLIRIA